MHAHAVLPHHYPEARRSSVNLFICKLRASTMSIRRSSRSRQQVPSQWTEAASTHSSASVIELSHPMGPCIQITIEANYQQYS